MYDFVPLLFSMCFLGTGGGGGGGFRIMFFYLSQVIWPFWLHVPGATCFAALCRKRFRTSASLISDGIPYYCQLVVPHS